VWRSRATDTPSVSLATREVGRIGLVRARPWPVATVCRDGARARARATPVSHCGALLTPECARVSGTDPLWSIGRTVRPHTHNRGSAPFGAPSASHPYLGMGVHKAFASPIHPRTRGTGVGAPRWFRLAKKNCARGPTPMQSSHASGSAREPRDRWNQPHLHPIQPHLLAPTRAPAHERTR
jgi:hypothetical protein